MNAWDGPRRARPDEFGEAMRFTDLVFRPGQTGRRILQRQYPHAYREGAAFSRRLLILRHGGDLVGCVGLGVGPGVSEAISVAAKLTRRFSPLP